VSGAVSRRSFLGATAASALLGASGRLVVPNRVSADTENAEGNASSTSAPMWRSAPPITITVPPHDTAPGVILLTPTKTTQYGHGPMIVNTDGKVVWFNPVAKRATNLQVQSYQGEPVLTWWHGRIVLGHGHGVYPMVNSKYQQVATVRAANGLKGDLHEFTISPEGTALFTVYQELNRDLSAVGGPVNGTLFDSLFQEVDIATGRLLMQWRASKHVALDESYAPVPTSPSDPYDFFHINSIDVDDDGNLLVSGRHTWCVYKINRTTGEIIWRLHGKRSDFKMGPGSHFYWQHHVRHHPGQELTIFDNGAGMTRVEKHSRGLKIALDTQDRRAQFVRQYLPHPRILSPKEGSVQVLPNSNVFVGWGKQPYFSEYTEDGTLLYVARLPFGIQSYRAFRSPWTRKV
jgi:hypothetical protein